MKQTFLVFAAISFVGCCSTKKAVKEQKESKIETETNSITNEQINTLISTSVNENEELIYTKVEFFPDIVSEIVGAGSVCPDNNLPTGIQDKKIKSVETLTKKSSKQTALNIKQNTEMKQQSKEKIKENIKSKTTQIKEIKTSSNVKYYLMLFVLVIGVLLWLKLRKWFNSKNK